MVCYVRKACQCDIKVLLCWMGMTSVNGFATDKPYKLFNNQQLIQFDM